MAPLYLGPYTVTMLLGPKTLSVDLPAEYAVSNAFNFEDVRSLKETEVYKAYKPTHIVALLVLNLQLPTLPFYAPSRQRTVQIQYVLHFTRYLSAEATQGIWTCHQLGSTIT